MGVAEVLQHHHGLPVVGEGVRQRDHAAAAGLDLAGEAGQRGAGADPDHLPVEQGNVAIVRRRRDRVAHVPEAARPGGMAAVGVRERQGAGLGDEHDPAGGPGRRARRLPRAGVAGAPGHLGGDRRPRKVRTAAPGGRSRPSRPPRARRQATAAAATSAGAAAQGRGQGTADAVPRPAEKPPRSHDKGRRSRRDQASSPMWTSPDGPGGSGPWPGRNREARGTPAPPAGAGWDALTSLSGRPGRSPVLPWPAAPRPDPTPGPG